MSGGDLERPNSLPAAANARPSSAWATSSSTSSSGSRSDAGRPRRPCRRTRRSIRPIHAEPKSCGPRPPTERTARLMRRCLRPCQDSSTNWRPVVVDELVDRDPAQRRPMSRCPMRYRRRRNEPHAEPSSNSMTSKVLLALRGRVSRTGQIVGRALGLGMDALLFATRRQTEVLATALTRARPRSLQVAASGCSTSDAWWRWPRFPFLGWSTE